MNGEDMPIAIFVKQRIRNFALDYAPETLNYEDTFVAVCTPTQLEDFPVNSPVHGSSYFRTNTVELVDPTAEGLDKIFQSLIYEVKKLVVDLTDLDDLETAKIFTITANSPITAA